MNPQWDRSNTDTKPTKNELDAEIVRLDAEYLANKISKTENKMMEVRECLVFKQVIKNWRTIIN